MAWVQACGIWQGGAVRPPVSLLRVTERAVVKTAILEAVGGMCCHFGVPERDNLSARGARKS